MFAAVCICRYLLLADILVFCKKVLDLPKSVLAKLRRRGFRAPCPCANSCARLVFSANSPLLARMLRHALARAQRTRI